MTSTSLTWKPYLTLEDCDQEGQNCAINYGMFNHLAKYLSAKFNMSFNSGKDPDNDWGTYPKNGSHDFSGHWGGAMGDVNSNVIGKSLISTYLPCMLILGYPRSQGHQPQLLAVHLPARTPPGLCHRPVRPNPPGVDTAAGRGRPTALPPPLHCPLLGPGCLCLSRPSSGGRAPLLDLPANIPLVR